MPFSNQGGAPLPRTLYTLNGGDGAIQVVPDNRQPPFRSFFALQNNSSVDIFFGEDNTVTDSGDTRGFRLMGNPDPTTYPDSTFRDYVINGPIYAYAAADATLLVSAPLASSPGPPPEVTMNLTDARVRPDGRAVQITWQAAQTAVGTFPLPDYTGAPSCNGQPTQFLGLLATAPNGLLTWQATYLVSTIVPFGGSAALILPPGLMFDATGNTTTAGSVTATNGSLVGSNGFTTTLFTRGTGGVTVYVSSSQGDDSRTLTQAQNPATPWATTTHALAVLASSGQHGKGAAIRCLQGDTFTAGGTIKTGGQDAAHPFIIEDYWYSGVGDPVPNTRPIFLIPGVSPAGFLTTGGGGTPRPLSHIVLRRIAIIGDTWVGGNVSHEGLVFHQAGANYTLDDVFVTNFGNGIVFFGAIDGVNVLNAIVTDCYYNSALTTAHSQGMYVDGVTNLLTTGSLFNFNGRRSPDLVERDIFSHNCYIQSNCGPALVYNNLIRAGGSHGVQQRPGGFLVLNYFGRNAIAGFIDTPGGTQRLNVIENAENISPSLPRGFGMEIISHYGPSIGQLVEDSICLRSLGTSPRAFTPLSGGGQQWGTFRMRALRAASAGPITTTPPDANGTIEAAHNSANLLLSVSIDDYASSLGYADESALIAAYVARPMGVAPLDMRALWAYFAPHYPTP